MIELNSVSFSAVDAPTGNVKNILKNINLTFPKGKITVITGHNGSGKSTLIKLIMGLIKPTEGKIAYNGEDITNLSVTQRAKLGFTMAFQQPVKFKGITVKDMLNIANKQVNSVSVACEYLSQVGLCAKDYINREINSSLSGGELKRIELAVALCKGGEVFLFDEPEAGIDLWSFDELVNIFKKQKNKTIIIVSHQKKILEIADYIAVLNSNSDPKMGNKGDMLKELTKKQCKNLKGVVNG